MFIDELKEVCEAEAPETRVVPTRPSPDSPVKPEAPATRGLVMTAVVPAELLPLTVKSGPVKHPPRGPQLSTVTEIDAEAVPPRPVQVNETDPDEEGDAV
jgi:hypothetical protein